MKTAANRISNQTRLGPALVLLLLLMGSVSSPAQRWTEVDGNTLLLRFEGDTGKAQRLDLHRRLLVPMSDLGTEKDLGELHFVSQASPGTVIHVRGRIGPAYDTQRTAAFETPLLDVGAWSVFYVQGNTRKRVATVEVPAFRCYFNRPGDPRQAASLAAVVLPVGMGSTMARLADRADKTLDIAMSDFDHPDYVAAVIRARQRGVRVRFITDARAMNDEMWARGKLTEAGVPWITNGRALDDPTYMHHKFMIVDEQVVLVGHAKAATSHDIVSQCFVSINGRPLARIYTDEFNQMWGSTGLDSPEDQRRFNVDKKPGNHHHCMVKDLHGDVRIDVGFGPAKKPSFSPLTRPLNFILGQLLLRATSDVGFLASGFGDIDIGKILHELITKKGIRFCGVQGEPDWSVDYNPLVNVFRGEGPDGWKEPADVVRSHEVDEEQKWMNLHNRAMVIDVLGQGTSPVVCFSSGAWCMGIIKADDSMVCIHDRGVAEQFLQHLGGARARAWRPLPHRNIKPLVKAGEGGLVVSAYDLIRLFGGKVVRSLDGKSGLLQIGSCALEFGPSQVGAAPVVRRRIPAPVSDRGLVPAGSLAYLGLALAAASDGGLCCRNEEGLTIPLEARGVLPELHSLLPATREEEDTGFGLVFSSSRGKTDKESGSESQPPKTHHGLVKLADRLPFFAVDRSAEGPILVDPHVVLAMEQAIRRLHIQFPGLPPLIVVDGAGVSDRSARNKARRSWRPRRGSGLVVQMPAARDAAAGRQVVRTFIAAMRQQGMARFHVGLDLLGKMEPLEFLNQSEPGSFQPYVRQGKTRPGAFMSRDRRVFISFDDHGRRQIECEHSTRDFRFSLAEDFE